MWPRALATNDSHHDPITNVSKISRQKINDSSAKVRVTAHDGYQPMYPRTDISRTDLPQRRYVLASIYSSTDVSPHRYVHATICPRIAMSQYRYVPTPINPSIAVSPYRYVPVPLCPYTDMSRTDKSQYRYAPHRYVPSAAVSPKRYVPVPLSPNRYAPVPLSPHRYVLVLLFPHRYVPVPMSPHTDTSQYRCAPAPMCPCPDVSPHRYVPVRGVHGQDVYGPKSHGLVSTLTLTLAFALGTLRLRAPVNTGFHGCADISVWPPMDQWSLTVPLHKEEGRVKQVKVWRS